MEGGGGFGGGAGDGVERNIKRKKILRMNI